MLQPIKKSRHLILFVLVVLFVILFLFPEMQKRPVHFLARPVVFFISEMQKGLTRLERGLGDTWNGYLYLRSVRRENRLLKEELTRLLNENVRLREAARANERLQQILEFKKGNAYAVQAAAVIGRDPSNWYRTLLIDKGEQDGVLVEMGVITPRGVVGRVIKTGPTVSQVLLLTDRNSAVAALIQGTRDEGLVEGTERGSARIKYLSLLAEAKEGDLVLTSGLTGIFPKGLRIGTLGAVMKNEPDLFQQAEVTPILDFSKLEEVLVITSLEGTGNAR